jgi:dipeptidyl aminopeptidase/acylaminoacyl peptidase
LQGLFDNYASRLLATADSIIAIEPAVAGDEVLFTTMVPSGYSVASWNLGSLAHITMGPDAFHPAVSGSGEGWVELASTTSQVVRLPLRGSGPGTALAAEVEDAEQPAVSLDGRWLLFIREMQSRGSLWIKELLPAVKSASVRGVESEAVGKEYDVLDAAFFPDHRIVFAAKSSDSSRLFVFDPKTWRVSPLPLSPQPTRYPAVSPDGQWLAYSQDKQGNWRLWVMRLPTGETRRLTGGDCNSITPAWSADSKTLVYATDCGRALGLTALCRIRAVP